MFPNPIALNNGTAAVNFDFRGSSINQSEYKNASADLDKEHKLNIKHTYEGTGSARLRKSLYDISRIVEDAQGVQGKIRVYCVVVIPEGIATTAQVTEEVTLMKDFLSEAGAIAKVVAGEN